MRKSISVAFFSLVSTLMVLGIVLMGASEWVLFKNYFAKDRYETLDQVVGVTQRTAQYLVQQAELPKGDELDALSTKLEIIGESAEAYLFFTDNDGRVMIASSPDKLESLTVPEEMMEKIDASDADYYHVFGTLGGMLDGKSYITVSEMRNENGQPSGYLFLCSSGEQLTQFKQQFWSNFLLSACVMLLCASILTKILMRQLTDPLQKVTDAAQRFGGGDLSVRVEGVEGEGEAADLARTFNRMADNIQMNDNSRGQFMGNIAHELRTPMTTIKGFVDGILDGTIPPDMQNHYLQLVSEETGRLARLIQNMLDLSKLESGEYQVNARMFNIWETITAFTIVRRTLRTVAIRAITIRTLWAFAPFIVGIKSRAIRTIPTFTVVRRTIRTFSSLSVVRPVTITAGTCILFIERIFAPFFVFCAHFFIRIKLDFGLTAYLKNTFIV